MDKFQVYKSSAGSGKTFTLVKEFLKWCFRSTSKSYYSKILAITFTNKATLEMKERVIDTLLNASNPDSVFNDLNLKIQEELSIPENKQRELSRNLISDILHNYGDFSISTIDKFSHKLVRTFAHDLRIPINFKVELDLKEVLQNVVSSFIDTVGKNKEYDQWIYNFSFNKLEDNKSWKVENELISLMNSLLQEKNRSYLEELKTEKGDNFIRLFNHYKEENESVYKEIKKTANKALDLIHSNGIEPSDFFQGARGIYSHIRKKTTEKDFLGAPNVNTLNTIQNDKWVSAKLSGTEIESRILGIGEDLKKCYFSIEEILAKSRSDYIIRKSIYKNLHSVALQHELARQLEAVKKEKNFINMVDINHKIAQIVLSEPMPFIYERLGEKYNHIMIDEFQDTSPLQFANLLPLIEEGLSRGKESLLVGDAKQAIYRFRGGDYKQLTKMPHLSFENFKEVELIEMRMDPLKSNYEKKTLNDNYRSKQKIVEFNNFTFEFAANSSLLSEEAKEIYDEVSQKANDKSGEGFVQIDFIDNEKDNENQLFDCLLDSIRKCIEDGYQLNEIAILTHKNDQSSQVAKFLSSHDIKVISSEALLVSNSEEVSFIINLLALINNNKDQIAFVKIIKYLANRHSRKLNDIYLELKNFESLNSYLKKEYAINLLLLNQLPLVHIVESLTRGMAFDEEYNVYVQFFLDIVFDYSNKEGNNIHLFLEFWSENSNKFSLDIPENNEAINLMTVHRSKGLEFKVVLFPFSSVSKGNHKALKWIDRLPPHETNAKIAVIEIGNELLETELSAIKSIEDQDEEIDLINRIYVAFTRASERLYIQCKPVNPKKGSELKISIDNLMHRFINESDCLSKVSDVKYTYGKQSVKMQLEGMKESNVGLELEYISYPSYQNLNFATESSAITSESILKGNVVHDIFYNMNSTGDLNSSLQKAKVKFNNYSNWQGLEDELLLLVNQKLFLEIFNGSDKVIKEREIVDKNGDIFRPDRVTEKDGKNILVDFKTGKKDSSHINQIKKYAELMQSLSPKVVEAYLIYVEDLDIQKVA